MRKFSLILCVLLAPPGTAQEDGRTLVQEAMCYACHQMEEASIGPSWRAIAARHAPRRELMTPVLVEKIIRGGGGNWGVVPMVPNQRVSETRARVMTEWILAQSPE